MAPLKFKLVVILSTFHGIEGQERSGFYALLDQNVEVANPTKQKTWNLDPDNISTATITLTCARFCESETNCSVFSYVENSTGFLCKVGATLTTRNATGSKMFFKSITGTDGYTRYLEPFRYKWFRKWATSPADASDFCFETDGSAIPVGYPDANAFKTLQMHLRSSGRKTRIFVGVELSRVHSNGSMEFRTLRDWPVFVDPGNRDPSQPWAPNEPTLPPQYDRPSDVAVMTTADGWFTVDARTAGTDAVVCMKHATFEFLQVTRRFHMSDTTSMVRSAAEAACQARGGFLARAYGTLGIELLKFYSQQRTFTSFWIAGTEVTAGSGFWKYPDGSTFDDSQRFSDPRQIFDGNNKVSKPGYSYCLKEFYTRWGGFYCSDSYPFLCEGGF